MFSGIIQALGRVVARSPSEGGLRLSVSPTTAFKDLEPGESVAVEGVCLTAEPGSTPELFGFFLSEETLGRTTLGDLETGAMLNLERSLAAGDLMGGHLVMGHVDSVGTIRRLEEQGEGWLLDVEFPSELGPFLAPKGSVAVDGISLTTVDVSSTSFTVAIVPYTYKMTTLHTKAIGSPVNLEADTIARYVVRYLSQSSSSRPDLSAEFLERAGF